MAKYTEQLGEYLKNNTLPTIFEEIENFKDLFILRYIDSEIGLETEWLFSQKLLLKANIVIPEYKTRLESLKTIENKLFNLAQTSYTDVANNTYNNGEQITKQVNLPLDSETAEPNNVTTALANINSDTRNLTHTEDLKANDLKMQYDTIRESIKILMNSLLNEFQPLFMGVY